MTYYDKQKGERMYRRNFSDVWEALSRVYLKDFEIMEYYRDGDRKKFVNLIKKRLFDDIWKRMKRYGETNPPFILENSKFVLNDRKAHIKKVDNVKYAEMEVKDDAFIILVNEKLSRPLQRTLIAHELGHTFLYNTNKVPIEPYFCRKRSLDLNTKNVRNIYKSSSDESIAYEIGRFFLVPSQALKNYVPQSASLNVFLTACKKFEISKESMARRLFWHIYDWSSGDKYWKDVFLILYPMTDIKIIKDFPTPSGNDKVFRGTFFKHFQLKKIWPLLAQMLYLTTNKPEKTITSDDCKRFSWYEPIKFKGNELRLEMTYMPSDYRIYILGSFNS